MSGCAAAANNFGEFVACGLVETVAFDGFLEMRVVRLRLGKGRSLKCSESTSDRWLVRPVGLVIHEGVHEFDRELRFESESAEGVVVCHLWLAVERVDTSFSWWGVRRVRSARWMRRIRRRSCCWRTSHRHRGAQVKKTWRIIRPANAICLVIKSNFKSMFSCLNQMRCLVVKTNYK